MRRAAMTRGDAETAPREQPRHVLGGRVRGRVGVRVEGEGEGER